MRTSSYCKFTRFFFFNICKQTTFNDHLDYGCWTSSLYYRSDVILNQAMAAILESTYIYYHIYLISSPLYGLSRLKGFYKGLGCTKGKTCHYTGLNSRINEFTLN